MKRRRKIHKTVGQVQPEIRGGLVTIMRLAHGGQGIGTLQGLTVFVPRTVPGDVVEVRITDQRRRYAFAEVVALQQASPWRLPAPCPVYDHCGGCHLQHLGYARQLSTKTTQVREALARIAKLPDIPVAPMHGSSLPFAYRNKVLYHYDPAHGALGLVARQGAGILDLPQCLINDPRADAVMARLRTLAAQHPALQNRLHHVQVQVGQRTAEVLITVIIREALSEALQQLLWDGVRDLATGLVLHHKHHDTPAVFAGTTSLIAGSGVIYERVGKQRFRIEPEAFFQVNTRQMEQLYALVQTAAALQPEDVVLDLYSGGGTIALTLAPHCAQVYAVDSNRQAMLLAAQQAQEQGIENCQFRTGKVERILYRYLAQGIRPRVAILDPPRAGCRPEALQALAALRVSRLVYVSCSPPTLGRDLQLLHALGYQTEGVQPLDMFPQTYHIECVATLTRAA
jgi:23S rRNA (uracil1939-C5)-methyltransferase